MKSAILVFLILIVFFSPLATQAAELPTSLNIIDGMSFKLIPRNMDSASSLGIKNIEAEHNSNGIKITWLCPERVHLESGQWPITKVILQKGALWTSGLSQAKELAHPDIWFSGVVNLSFNGIIWANPSVLSLTEKETLDFEPGFLGPSFFNFVKSRSADIGTIDSFRRLFSLYSGLNRQGKNPDKDTKQVNDFFDQWKTIKILDKNRNWPLTVNNSKTQVPVIIAGNRFIQYVILKSPHNPLILSVRFFTDNVPEKVLTFVKYFHENMEYSIDQIQTKKNP